VGLLAFTENNFRTNLKRLTGVDAPSSVEAHHVLPLRFAELFAAKGLNVHDPRLGVWVEGGGQHQSWSKSYNEAWKVFFDTHSNASAEAILAHARRLAGEQGVKVNF
jgi:hypothetical protein